MSDSDQGEKKPGVPSWQLQSNATESKETKAPTPASPNREPVIEQAKKFLEEEEVQNASTDRKIAFLESKGLNGDEITELLGVKRNEEATALPQTSQSPPNETLQPPSNSSPPPFYPSQPARDSPPIITYPEFLTTPPHPTPLVTKSRLLKTLYLFGGLSTLLYGTNTYLVEPMLRSLTTSRIELAETTSENLQKLLNKLESVVSEVPPLKSGKLEIERQEDEESDEDPTEMFHRDIGVQTSLPATPSLSRPASPSPQAKYLDDQTTKLTNLNTSISGLVEDTVAEGHEIEDLSTTIRILQEYLEGLTYVAPTYGYGGPYGGLGGSNVKDQDDEIGRVKASIRGVKGVLLSTRSFPGGSGRVRAG